MDLIGTRSLLTAIVCGVMLWAGGCDSTDIEFDLGVGGLPPKADGVTDGGVGVAVGPPIQGSLRGTLVVSTSLHFLLRTACAAVVRADSGDRVVLVDASCLFTNALPNPGTARIAVDSADLQPDFGDDESRALLAALPDLAGNEQVFRLSGPVRVVTRELGLSDVSILFPIADASALLGETSAGAKGALFPPALRKKALDFSPFEPSLLNDPLQVVAMRLDDCSLRATPVCRREIRLVLQPVGVSGGVPTAHDSAVHLVFELTAAEFSALIEKIADLSGGAAIALPLGLHPLLKLQGSRGPFALAIQQLILQYSGVNNLRDVTVVGASFIRIVRYWEFFNFAWNGTALLPAPILHHQFGFSHDRLTNGDKTTELSFGSTYSTAPDALAAWSLANSAGAALWTAATVQTSIDALYRIDNPALHNFRSIDCITCHLAPSMRGWTQRHFGRDDRNNPNAFRSFAATQSLTESALRTDSMRAFGYVGELIAISDRTIHESALVADRVSQQLSQGSTDGGTP